MLTRAIWACPKAFYVKYKNRSEVYHTMPSEVTLVVLGVGEHPETVLLRGRAERVLEQLRLGQEVRIIESNDLDSMFEADLQGIPALVIDQHIICQSKVPTEDDLYRRLLLYFKGEASEKAA